MIVRFGVWITSQKRVYCLSNVIQYSIKTQHSKCKNANPKRSKPTGLAAAQTGFRVWQNVRVTRVFQNPGFNPYRG